MHISARDIEAVAVRHGVVDRGVRPFPLSGRFPADRVDPLKHPCVQAEGKIRVQIVHEPDLVHAITVQVEGNERGIPDTGDGAGAEIARPHGDAVLGIQRHFQRILRIMELLRPGIEVPLRGIHEKDGFRHAGAERHRYGTDLPERHAHMEFFQAFDIHIHTSFLMRFFSPDRSGSCRPSGPLRPCTPHGSASRSRGALW